MLSKKIYLSSCRFGDVERFEHVIHLPKIIIATNFGNWYSLLTKIEKILAWLLNFTISFNKWKSIICLDCCAIFRFKQIWFVDSDSLWFLFLWIIPKIIREGPSGKSIPPLWLRWSFFFLFIRAAKCPNI